MSRADRPRTRRRLGPRRRGVGDGRHDRRAADARPRDHGRARCARAGHAPGDRRAPERDARVDGAACPRRGCDLAHGAPGRDHDRRPVRPGADREDRAPADRRGAGTRECRDRRRVPGPERPGRRPGRDHDPWARRLGHDGGRPGGRAPRGSLPDLHRREGDLHRGPPARAGGSPAVGHRLRGDAGARPPGRPGHAGPGGRARLGQRRRHRGPQLVRGRTRDAHQGGSDRGAAEQGSGSRPRPERREGHARRGARSARAWRDRSSSRSPRPGSTST